MLIKYSKLLYNSNYIVYVLQSKYQFTTSAFAINLVMASDIELKTSADRGPKD